MLGGGGEGEYAHECVLGKTSGDEKDSCTPVSNLGKEDGGGGGETSFDR